MPDTFVGYSSGKMSLLRSKTATTKPASTDESTQRAQRAERLATMFERWRADDAPGEPAWDIDDIERLRFRDPIQASQTDSGDS